MREPWPSKCCRICADTEDLSTNKRKTPWPTSNRCPPETTPELQDDFAIFERILGFVPNSLLTMQRMPGMVKGFGELTKAVMDPNGSVDLGFMRLIAHFSSRAAGCQYCEAHSLVAAKIHGISQEKLDAIWEYRESPLYSEAERVALDYALAAGSVPNAVDAELVQQMKAALERTADRSNPGCSLPVRFPQPLERLHGHRPGRIADSNG